MTSTQNTPRIDRAQGAFLGLAVGDAIALAILAVPAAPLWGLLAFITNYVPNIGFVLGVVPPALLGLLAGGWGDLIPSRSTHSHWG